MSIAHDETGDHGRREEKVLEYLWNMAFDIIIIIMILFL